MAAPRKYGEELRERATRMAVDARKDPSTRSGAIPRIAEQLGMHPETHVRCARDPAGGLRSRPGPRAGDTSAGR